MLTENKQNNRLLVNQFPEMYIPQNQYNLFPVINIQ